MVLEKILAVIFKNIEKYLQEDLFSKITMQLEMNLMLLIPEFGNSHFIQVTLNPLNFH